MVLAWSAIDLVMACLIHQVAYVEKTVASVTPDKSAVMFKIFCTDEAALHKFIEGTEVSKPVMDEVLGSYTIYDLTKVKEG